MEVDDRRRRRLVNTLTNLDNKYFKYDIQPWVFFISAVIIILGVIGTIIAGVTAKEAFQSLQNNIARYAGWFYILVVNIVLFYCISLIFSQYGNLKIGGPEAEPEFSTISWFAMLFSAGMGIGLLFYGVAEPIYHFAGNYFNEPTKAREAKTAMNLTFMHWGFHPWGIYAIVGLGLAFFGFSEHLPLSVRNIFYPLLKNKIYGWVGNTIDIIAVTACLYGVATSLGIGVKQINAGLHVVFGLPENAFIQTILIACITAIATWSVVRGLDAGIKLLSNINMTIVLLILLFMLFIGPTLFIFNSFVENIGSFLQQFPKLAMWKEAYTMKEWQVNWTIFYWGWWIAWSPFVGMFIARISYGRTIREFLTSVLFVPTLLTFFWMTVFGGSALYIELYQGGGLIAPVKENIAVALFTFFDYFPLHSLISIFSIIVIISFFVTSSDSGSMVVDIISSGGNPDPPKPQRLFWAILEGVVAAALLLGGGLVALQTASVLFGFPFAIILLFMCWSIKVGLDKYVEKYGWD
ncbi:MAG: BCCT family transporter [Deferribacterota bacterium]|nr:BCCT family transporter [Deferribacterota bacterium]